MIDGRRLEKDLAGTPDNAGKGRTHRVGSDLS